MKSALFLLATSLAGTLAIVPAKTGYTISWSDDFNGAAGSAPNATNWSYKTGPNANWNELQQYVSSTANARLSGSGALQLIPLKSASGQWTSARLESKNQFECPVGKSMIIEAEVRMGTNTNQQGIWPAFWALGASQRRATNPVAWPACGEYDIFEARNGVASNFGTLHCNVAPGGFCNEYVGLGAQSSFTKGTYSRWAVKVDRTQTDDAKWKEQSITYLKDMVPYKRITGADVQDHATWVQVARSPFYLITNVAVGGDFPGQPTAATVAGLESGIQIAFVAVYISK